MKKKNLINIHKRYFVLPVMTSPAGSKLRTILKEKVTSFSAGVGTGTIGFYGYDYYHKNADRAISNKNLEIAIKNHEIAIKNHEINIQNHDITAQKAKEEIYLAKYYHLKEEKNKAENIYADCKDSWSFFNNVKNKEAFAKKNIEEAELAIENIKKDASNDGIKLYSVVESFFFN